MAKKTEYDESIEHHKEAMFGHIQNYRRGIEVGSYQSAERQLNGAAAHAAILTALFEIRDGR